MKNRTLLLGGILAPIFYVAVVIAGGLLRPGYSQVAQYVSELIEAGAPNKALLDPLFAVYNLLTMAFALGLWNYIRGVPGSARKSLGVTGACVLLIEGLVGFLTVFFPQDPIGSAATTTGTVHIALAGLSSLTTMLAMLFIGLWLSASPSLRGFGWYSFVSVTLVFVSGGMAAATIAHPGPFNGLIERITIGGFLQWLVVIGLKTIQSGSSKESSHVRTQA